MITQKTIHQLTKEVLEELKKHGYTKGSIQKYAASYKRLMGYTDSQGITTYSETVGLNFLNHEYGYKLEGFFGTLHHLLILWHYQKYSTVSFITRSKKKAFSCTENYKDEYDAFLEFCKLKQYSKLGIPAILNPVKKFILFLESNHINNLSDMTQEYLSLFLSIYADHSVRYFATQVSGLRNFLTLLYDQGFIQHQVSGMLPNVRYSRNGFIPPSWKKEDVKKLLKAIDRRSPLGKMHRRTRHRHHQGSPRISPVFSAWPAPCCR